MRASEIMTEEVISIAPSATIAEAANLMLKERISGLPVIDDNRNLVGIITEGDLLRRVEAGTVRRRPRWLEFLMTPHRLAVEYVHSHSTWVADLMTSDVAVAPEDAALADIAEIMERRRINRVPIVRDRLVVGMVTRANMLRALLLAPPPPTHPDDQRIRQDVIATLKGQKWNARYLQVGVRDGVVDVSGLIADERSRDAIRVAVENVQGVRKIRDHLRWAAVW